MPDITLDDMLRDTDMIRAVATAIRDAHCIRMFGAAPENDEIPWQAFVPEACGAIAVLSKRAKKEGWPLPK